MVTVRAGTVLVLTLHSAALLEAQGLPATLSFADGRQLSGKVAFGSATFVQGQGITDAGRPTDTLYFRADGAMIAPVRAGEIRMIQIRYIPVGHGLLRRKARMHSSTAGRTDGSISVWHEAPAGPGRLVFTRYVEVEDLSGISRRIELADCENVPRHDRVVAIRFKGPIAPEQAPW